ncbi:helix-turn-helix domain-containing protein [Microbacterium sp.]|uniref:helix-turn-helix domain-containing protein n=1 Tax=Actinomycetes TaxID=1760 RepID=UPI0037C7C399
MSARDATAYVHGIHGPVVVVPARVCAYLGVRAGLDEFRVNHRGIDAEVDNVLVAMRTAALAWRSTATGTTKAPAPEPAAHSGWLTTEQAASHLGITSRGVRKAIQRKHLPATRTPDGRWRITREDLEHYKTRSMR